MHVSAMTNKNADAGLGVLHAKWRRTFQPRFRMRRRRGVIRRAVTAAPRAHSFLSCQKLQCSAPFSLRGKEKAAGGKKKTAKGDFDFPLCNPLKTTKKGAAAPFLGFSPGLGLCGICFQIYKTRDRCVFDRPARSSKYSASVSIFIRQIFNGHEQNDTHRVSCAQETRSDGRPKGVLTAKAKR